MLILTRRPGESIKLDHQIDVIVLSINAGVVRLGIQAPTTISVHRDEVYARIQAEKRMMIKNQDINSDEK